MTNVYFNVDVYLECRKSVSYWQECSSSFDSIYPLVCCFFWCNHVYACSGEINLSRLATMLHWYSCSNVCRWMPSSLILAYL